jgi:hypothetical protein
VTSADFDGDGIPDSVEQGSSYTANDPNSGTDSNNDGVPDWKSVDSDGDGLADSIEKGSPTSGALEGTSFTAHDFTGDNQNLIVVVDGGTPQTIAVVANCDTLVNCAAALSPLINGATGTVEGRNLKITSDTTGLSSTIAITATGSGVNALALFGPNPVVVNGGVTVDTDHDGVPDYIDDDSDGDGVKDIFQKGTATCCAPLPGKVGDPTDTGKF